MLQAARSEEQLGCGLTSVIGGIDWMRRRPETRDSATPPRGAAGETTYGVTARRPLPGVRARRIDERRRGLTLKTDIALDAMRLDRDVR